MWRGRRSARIAGQLQVGLQHLCQPRVDVYTEKSAALSPAAQGMVGIVNAKRIWQTNQQFWADKKVPLAQEMIFASTGTKKPDDPPWKYVDAFAGSDIETNPPATNDAVAEERPDVHAAGRSDAAGRSPRRDRREGRHAEAGNDADGRGHQEIRRPAERPLLKLIASKRRSLG